MKNKGTKTNGKGTKTNGRVTRPWYDADHVRAQRNHLLHGGAWGDPHITSPHLLAQVSKSRRPVQEPIVDLEQLRLLYPYTKSMEISNDGIGYGELVRVTLWCDGKITRQCRRRTRTGFRLIEPDQSKE